MAKIKVGVIGCGKIANNAHIPSYMANKEAEIVYFCDIIPERAEKAVETYKCGKAITDYHEILNDPQIDAVSVCTPNKAHSVIAIEALKAGKHVLCEKPAARTYAEVEEMQKTAKETGKVLNIGVVNRFNDAVNKIREIIQAGELGEVFHVYVSFRAHRSIPGLGGDFTTHAVSGGGVLIDWGVHYLDIVMYCTGDPTAKTVSSEMFSRLGNPMEDYAFVGMWAGPPKLDGTYDVEDSITGVIRTDGPVITFQGAWAQNIGESETYIDFIGTKGGIRLQYGRDFTLYSTKNGMLSKTTYQMTMPNMYEEEIAAFVSCIETGEKCPAHIDTNIITAKMMDAIYRSAETHREVVL